MLQPLLQHLAQHKPVTAEAWQGWQIEPVHGGSNGLVYHISGSDESFAVKFTLRDSRNRAMREYQALCALADARLDIAPKPILLDTDHYEQDVVVQTWLAGDVIQAPPNNDDDWHRLIVHLAAIHSLTPPKTQVELDRAILNAPSAADSIALARWQASQLPEPPVELQQLFRQLEQANWPEWSAPAPALCRTDPNILNFIRRSPNWASVDWENSGWGDPAFEIADLMIHPAYMDVDADRWEWVIATYCQHTNDADAEQRIRTYYPILAVWWVARLARYLYEIPNGLDQRLIERPADWQQSTQMKFEHYVRLAQRLL
ncbi:MAG: hypothetical protein CL610_17910 [Anaerolineaceae bacterium]|nr:hypothetical protein [Anaerolineaceae bacterium]